MKKVVIIVFVLIANFSFSQEKRTISGFITNEKTGEKLIGAIIYDTISKKGVETNEYGFFSLTIPAKDAFLRISYFGLQRKHIPLTLETNELNIALSEVFQEVEEVTILGTTKRDIENTNTGTIELQLDKVEKLPLILGEKDVLRTLQLLPGVKSGGEASSGIYVRGGGPDQNLILLDGVPIYNASHLFGFFSVFNSDALSNVTLIKGGFPARYGGRASSVLDIRMKEGNMKNYNVEGSIGLISSKILVEGPIKKDKTAFSFSARRTYLDLLYRPFLLANGDGIDAFFFFHDVNAKVHHKINDKNHIYLSGYFGLDKISATDKYKFENFSDGTKTEMETKNLLQWGNSIGAIRWNHIINSKLFVNTTATFSKYKFLIGTDDYSESKNGSGAIIFSEKSTTDYNSGIQDWGIKSDFTYFPNPNHNIKFGISEIYHTFTPGVTHIKDKQNPNTTLGSSIQYSHELSLYLEDDFKMSSRLKINYGLHHSIFLTGGKTYQVLQPRFSGNFMLDKNSSIKLGISRMTQFLHLLSNTGIGLPTDLWVPATNKMKPVLANQISLGYYLEFKKDYNFSLEGYYKKMNNVIQYKEGANFLSENKDWQQKVTVGKGWSYGTEILIEKKRGKLTGWLGYTLSWSERQFDDLNFGRKFFYRYDRRHDISLALTYDLNKTWDLGLVFVYGTGNAVTIGSQIYPVAPNLPVSNSNNTLNSFDQLNGYRMPSYNRMDIGANYKKNKKWGQSIYSFSIYNVYARQNPFMIYTGVNDKGKKTLMQISLFSIVPSISWKFKFDFEKIKKNRYDKKIKNDNNK